MLSTITILNTISEKRASDIFKCIASASSDTDIFITQLKLTRKQYYSRMFRLKKVGIVKRQNGRYVLTEFGKVIYCAYMNLEANIESAINNYWKLKTIDSLQMSLGEERIKLIDALIDNQEIRRIIMNKELPLPVQSVLSVVPPEIYRVDT